MNKQEQLEMLKDLLRVNKEDYEKRPDEITKDTIEDLEKQIKKLEAQP